MRSKRSSGNCDLVDAESEAGKILASTIYHWGPGKNPVVRINGQGEGGEGEEFEVLGKSLVSRSTVFECRGVRFEWRYVGRKERSEGVSSLLVLEKVEGERVRVAQLVRGEGTRSPGSSGSSAGNGGRLEVCLDCLDGEVKGEGKVIDEKMVVSTCLVMLKKEVDRRRALQVAMISIAVSGGS